MLKRSRLPHGSQMIQWPANVGQVSAQSRVNDAEFHRTELRAGQVLPSVVLSLWSAFGGRWNEEEGQ